jgi:hypothetical protein
VRTWATHDCILRRVETSAACRRSGGERELKNTAKHSDWTRRFLFFATSCHAPTRDFDAHVVKTNGVSPAARAAVACLARHTR